MKAWELPLLAVIPLVSPDDAPPPRHPPCAIAVAIDVRATLVWGAVEWHILTSEVERVWAPYGVTFCWQDRGDGCAGVEVRLRVLIADDALPPTERRAGGPAVGRIQFLATRPGTEIQLSWRAARDLVVRANLGGQPIGSWPSAIETRLVPRVLGRALAHEVGHYVLGSRDHARTGLMAAHFRPDDVTFGSSTRFGLSQETGAAVRNQCVARVPAGVRAESLRLPVTPGQGRGQ
jgi:hypothetical protein